MREILFRGRCTGEDGIYGWVDGFYVRLRDPYKKRESHRIYTGFAECDCGDFYGDWYEVDPKTVGRFTGLFDKEGERIFEGDIVRDIFLNSKKMYEVKFTTDYNCGFEPFCEQIHGGHMLLEPEDCEVIGNIHDNPELME